MLAHKLTRTDLSKLSTKKLDRIYDRLVEKGHKRFPDRDTEISIIEKLMIDVGPEVPAVPQRKRGINIDPLAKATPARAGTNQALFIDMLSRPQGATLDELAQAQAKWAKLHKTNPWADSTIKAGVTWDMKYRRGYGIRSEHDEKRGVVMHLVMPRGLTKPLPHEP